MVGEDTLIVGDLTDLAKYYARGRRISEERRAEEIYRCHRPARWLAVQAVRESGS